MQKKSFEVLKKRFIIKLILVALDLDRKMRMKIYISDYAIERMLSIECEDEKQRLVVYLSKLLNKTEHNYEIHDKEMLVVIRELEVWKHSLENTKFKFKVETDYKNLKYFIKVHKLNWRQARQALYLSRFDFTLKHILGVRMEKVDRLSRRPDLKVGVENNNENQKLIKEKQIQEIIEVVVEGLEAELVEKIKRARGKNKKVVKVRVKVSRGDE